MKLTAIILLSACLTASANGFGQRISLSEKNAYLSEVFKKIEKQTDYTFAYTGSQLSQAKRVTVEIDNGTLEQVLALCFKDQPFTYVIIERTITVKPNTETANEQATSEPAPPIDIKGRVVNEKGEPLEGVTVTVKGTKNATATDVNGMFELKGVDENSTLFFSGVNVESYEIKVNGKTEFAVDLKTKITIGETVTVVSTGYQEIPKERATGSFVSIDNKLVNRSVSTDILSRLNGIASGLLFDKTSGNPLNLSIRGRSTIFANTQPLIIVDNFPYDGDFNNINPNDIEKITILKDAAAASIWGVNAGNGVIVITTKRGKYNRPLKVELNTNLTIGKKPDLYYDPNFLRSAEYINVESFLFNQGYYDADIANTVTFPDISPVVEILDMQRRGLIIPVQVSAQLNALGAFDIRNDLSKYFYRNSVNQQHAVNFMGGGEKTAYFFSAGYDRNQLNNTGNEYERVTLNLRNSFTPIKNLEISAGINYTLSTKQNANALSNLSTRLPYSKLADNYGNPLPVTTYLRTFYMDSLMTKGFLDWRYYPLNELQLSNNKTKLNDNLFSAAVKYSIIPGLEAEIDYKHQRSSSENKNLQNSETYVTRDLINRFSVLNSNGSVTRNIPIGSIFDKTTMNIRSNDIRGHLNYDKDWGMHSVSCILGLEAREIITDLETHRLYGYNDEIATYSNVNYDSLYVILPSGTGKIPYIETIGGRLDRFRTYFFNGSYTYKQRYTVSASARIDQSNLFGVKTNQKAVPLWSAGIKWDVDKETFYSISWLPVLKLRTTYGYQGNVDKSVSAFTTARYFTGGLFNNSIAAIQFPGNPELRWEKIGTLNIGLDFGFKEGILSGNIEYFKKNGVDMIGDDPLDPTTGLLLARGNFSDISVNGLEIVLNSRILNREEFKWDAQLLYSRAADKVTKYKGGVATTQIIEGRPVVGVYSLRWGGLDATGDPMGYLNDTLSKNYSNLNQQLTTDRIYNGHGTPVVSGGFRNTFNWKNLSFSINITYKAGYYFQRSSIAYNALFSGSSAGHRDFAERWQKQGDETKTNVPSMIYPGDNSRDAFYLNSEVLVEKGDHIRLQDINVTYNLTKKQWAKLPFNNVELYLYANNLGILWRANKESLDPDFLTGFPTPRSISVGLRTNF